MIESEQSEMDRVLRESLEIEIERLKSEHQEQLQLDFARRELEHKKFVDLVAGLEQRDAQVRR